MWLGLVFNMAIPVPPRYYFPRGELRTLKLKGSIWLDPATGDLWYTNDAGDDEYISSLPTGGSTGNILAKASDESYDFEWSAPGAASHPDLPTHDALGLATDTEVEAILDAHENAGDPHPVYALDTDLGGYQATSAKGVALGYASLDAGGKVPDSEIPSTIARDSELPDLAGHIVAGDPHSVYALDSDLSTHAADTTSVHGITDTSVLETTSGAQAKVDTHVNDAADAHDASAISILDAAADFTATDVEGALAELQSDAEAHIAAGDPHTGYRLESADHTHASTGAQAGTIDHGVLTGLSDDDHTQYQKESEKGAANGYASLGSDSLVPQDQLGTGAQDGSKFLRDDGTWQAVSGSGVTDADFLVGTAHGGLSAEIVVGTAPGGELGGTWASPTVDATHSGSAHSAYVEKAGGQFDAGSASAGSWPQLTAGSLLTTAEVGALELDATNLYGTTDAGNRGYIGIYHFIRADGTRTLPNDTNENAIFNSPANGRITLETGVYRFQAQIFVTAMSATTGNALIDWLGAGYGYLRGLALDGLWRRRSPTDRSGISASITSHTGFCCIHLLRSSRHRH